MKYGMRKPSPKKSISARTKGRATRAAKRAVNPFYGKKGMGYIRDPKRAIKNAIYKRTTFGIGDLFK
ncbi:MAG: hypothetical protein QM234_09015 [Acidobacteriota bacterium]|jgi:hypothetical protein|nr:hypothetical protein [Acidobacteriota bacterium]